MHKRSPEVQHVVNTIGFLKWAELIDFPTRLDRIFISPDVNSLHIVWTEGGDIHHEIADYEDYNSFSEMLEEEVGDDSWDVYEGEADGIYEWLSDYSSVSDKNIKKVAASDLDTRDLGERP